MKSTFGFFISLAILITILLSCGNKDKKDKSTYTDTITKDWYAASTIIEKTKPQETKYIYKDGKTKTENGKSNEQINKIIFADNLTYNELNTIYLFYKEYYNKRASQLDDQLTITISFYNKRISSKDADPDNYEYDPKIDEYACGHFSYNYLNKFHSEGDFKK